MSVEKHLTEKEIEHIKVHSYKSAGYSWLDNQMNPFWIFCAKNLPYWLSPNMVTLLGLIFQLFGIILILFYDYSMTKDLPWWVYVFLAFCIFMYQTLDAIDGKHARNTGRSSPVGQLMDHGCDAFSNSFMIIMVIQSHKLGGCFNTIMVQALIQITFYIVQWQEYYTGFLLTHVNNIGVTEFQFIGMFLIMIPVFMGGSVSQAKFFGMTIYESVIYMSAAFSIYSFCSILSKNIKSKQEFLIRAYPMISVFTLTLAELLCIKLNVYVSHTLYIIILNGIFFGFMTCKLILCTMIKRPIENFTWDNLIYLSSIIVCIYLDNIYFEILILSLNALYISFKYFSFMFGIVNELLFALKINF